MVETGWAGGQRGEQISGGVPLSARRAPGWVDAVVAAVAAAVAVAALLTANLPAIDPGLREPEPWVVVVTAIGALGLGLRRRQPLAGLLLVGAAATIVSATGHYTALLPYLTLIALYSVAAHGTRRQALTGVLVIVVCFTGLVALGVPDLTLGDVVTSSALGVAAAAVGDAVRLRRAHQESLVAAAESRADAARAEAARVVADERLRIARELHDVVAHSMSLIAVQAGVGAHLIHDDPKAAERALDVIADTSREALAQTRSVIGLLRSGDDAQPSVPGLAALEPLVQGVRDAGLPVTLAVTGDVRQVPAAVDLAAYRIVQEALTNAVRHAPGRPVTVRLARDGDALNVEVDDRLSDASGVDGAEFAPAAAGSAGTAGSGGSSGFGLVGLRERAAAVGGSFAAGPTTAGGFRVSARLPIHAAAAS
jgi:signal transduction histidine kinase